MNSIRIDCSPFDDPIVGACFASVETAGEAIRSFSNSITSKDGIIIAEVSSVTPQSYSKMHGERGTRVDVKSKTLQNQDIILEVNMYVDKFIHQRNFLAASQIITMSSTPNTTPEQMAKHIPYVIAINILNYTIRDDHDDWLQPARFVYTKPPHIVALPQYVSYDIELPKFKHAKPDWTDDAYCWMYALTKAHEERKTMKEVVSMVTDLKPFSLNNNGFKQFSERYEFIATNDEIRNEYYKWQRELLRQAGIMEAAHDEGMAKGMAKGRVEGRVEGKAEGRVEGKAEGKAEGQTNTLDRLVKLGLLTSEQVANYLTVDE